MSTHTQPDIIWKWAANEDPHAYAFCAAWENFCHTLDDLHDRDKRHTAWVVAQVFAQFVLTLSANPFYLKNSPALLGAMLLSAGYWAESERRRGAERDIMKAQWNSVHALVAQITGGFERMTEVVRLLRFDYESEPDVPTDPERKGDT